MNDQERLAIEHACARLVTAFHVHIDAFEHDHVIDLFAEDAVWIHPMMGTLKGHAPMRQYLDSKSRKPAAMHITTNILIDVIDDTHAKGRAYYTLYYDGEGRNPAPITGPTAVGQYTDEFIRTDKGWRFSRRAPKNAFTGGDFANLILVKGDEEKGSAQT